MKFNITILIGGGKTQTEVIVASSYGISDVVKFYNQEGKLTHCYPSSKIYFTIDINKFENV